MVMACAFLLGAPLVLRRNNHPENNDDFKLLIFNMFYQDSPLLSATGDNNDIALSAAPGLV